jgi:hypothetical protein
VIVVNQNKQPHPFVSWKKEIEPLLSSESRKQFHLPPEGIDK